MSCQSSRWSLTNATTTSSPVLPVSRIPSRHPSLVRGDLLGEPYAEALEVLAIRLGDEAGEPNVEPSPLAVQEILEVLQVEIAEWRHQM